jgi:hypothetical protein
MQRNRPGEYLLSVVFFFTTEIAIPSATSQTARRGGHLSKTVIAASTTPLLLALDGKDALE